jgi:hypothetical protein
LRCGHLDVFDYIIDTGRNGVLGPRLAAASVAYGGIDLLERLERMGCPVDGWTLMVGAAVLPLAAMESLLKRQSSAPAHFVAALLGRIDLLNMLGDRVGGMQFTSALAAALDPAVLQWIWSSSSMLPPATLIDRHSKRLSRALATRAAGLAAHDLADLLLNLQREGHVALLYQEVVAGPRGLHGCIGVPAAPVVHGAQGMVAGPRGAVGYAGLTDA